MKFGYTADVNSMVAMELRGVCEFNGGGWW